MIRVERDCSDWAHEQVKLRLQDLEVSTETRKVKIVSVSKIAGDVTVSQRKGRLRHNFDLNINFKWESDEDAKGLVEIRDFMSDTDKKGFEFYVKADENGPAVSQDLKTFLLATLKNSVWETLQDFTKDLVNEHGKHLLVPSEPSASKSDSNEPVLESFKAAPSGSPSNGSGETMEWSETVNFQAPASELFKTLTEPERVVIWSRGPLQGSLSEAGKEFKLFSGAVSGKVLEVDPASHRLCLEWKLSSWAHPSVVHIEMIQEGLDTVLKLKQRNIPADQLEAVSTNWSNYYWNPIKSIFGFGAVNLSAH